MNDQLRAQAMIKFLRSWHSRSQLHLHRDSRKILREEGAAWLEENADDLVDLLERVSSYLPQKRASSSQVPM